MFLSLGKSYRSSLHTISKVVIIEMEIILNNEKRSISSPKLLDLLHEILGDKTKGTAVAVNETVILRMDWGNFELKENDKVIIIKATQGG